MRRNSVQIWILKEIKYERLAAWWHLTAKSIFRFNFFFSFLLYHCRRWSSSSMSLFSNIIMENVFANACPSPSRSMRMVISLANFIICEMHGNLYRFMPFTNDKMGNLIFVVAQPPPPLLPSFHDFVCGCVCVCARTSKCIGERTTNCTQAHRGCGCTALCMRAQYLQFRPNGPFDQPSVRALFFGAANLKFAMWNVMPSETCRI